MTTRTRTTTTNISSVHHHSKQQHVSSLFLFCSYSLPNPSIAEQRLSVMAPWCPGKGVW